jgi:preprotein translocase subunit SecB
MTRVNIAWHEPSQPGSVEIDYLFDYDVARHAIEKNRFRLAFRVGVKSKTPAPVDYSLDCEIVGFFHFPENTKDDDMQRLIRLNGCTLLYGILRGQLANITGSFPRQKLILPTVMMEDVVNNIEQEKAQAREAQPSAGKKTAKKATKRAKPSINK